MFVPVFQTGLEAQFIYAREESWFIGTFWECIMDFLHGRRSFLSLKKQNKRTIATPQRSCS